MLFFVLLILVTFSPIEYQTQEMRTITEVLEHQPGALCGLIKAVLAIDDDSNVSLYQNTYKIIMTVININFITIVYAYQYH